MNERMIEGLWGVALVLLLAILIAIPENRIVERSTNSIEVILAIQNLTFKEHAMARRIRALKELLDEYRAEEEEPR